MLMTRFVSSWFFVQTIFNFPSSSGDKHATSLPVLLSWIKIFNSPQSYLKYIYSLEVVFRLKICIESFFVAFFNLVTVNIISIIAVAYFWSNGNKSVVRLIRFWRFCMKIWQIISGVTLKIKIWAKYTYICASPQRFSGPVLGSRRAK